MYVFVAIGIRDHTRAAEIGLEVEDLVVELDEVAPVAGVARTDRGHARLPEVDRVHVVRASDIPSREAVGVRRAGVEEVAVACLHFPGQGCLGGVGVGDGAELQVLRQRREAGKQ